MNRILVTYTTKYGSTSEVAQAISEELRGSGAAVDARPISEAGDLARYDAVVVGGPMIIGWHREAVRFLNKNRDVLSRKRVACFLTAKALTRTGEDRLGETALFQDPGLAKPPRRPGKLGLAEKQATPAHYLAPVLKLAPDVRPVAAGFFGGKLDFSRLSPLALLFVKVVVRAKEGDSRDWETIRSWARGLAPMLVPAQ